MVIEDALYVLSKELYLGVLKWNEYQFPEPPKPLDIVKKLLKIGSEIISREVKNREAAKSNEDVVREDSEAVMLQRKGE